MELPQQYDFDIRPNGPVSEAFLSLGHAQFSSACRYVKQLPYRRNTHKSHVMVALEEGFGTCSTKHAALKTLALENEANDVQLRLGIYRMHGGNAPGLTSILEANGLAYLPEAHWFLRIHDKIVDCTFPAIEIQHLEQELLFESSIGPTQIGTGKDQIHRNFMGEWLAKNPSISLDLDSIWKVREACIFELSNSTPKSNV